MLLLLSRFSREGLFAIPKTVARWAHLSMGFSRQEYWSDFHFLLQGIFLTQGLSLLCLPAFADWFLITSATWDTIFKFLYRKIRQILPYNIKLLDDKSRMLCYFTILLEGKQSASCLLCFFIKKKKFCPSSSAPYF